MGLDIVKKGRCDLERYSMKTLEKISEFAGNSHAACLGRHKYPDAPKEFNLLNFEEVEYIDTQGQRELRYNTTRDGFSAAFMTHYLGCMTVEIYSLYFAGEYNK